MSGRDFAVSGASSDRDRRSRNEAASTVLILWPWVARIKKCDGFVSSTERACAVEFCCSSLVDGADPRTAESPSDAGPCCLPSATDSFVGSVVASSFDVSAEAEGMCNSAKRFLSDDSTACRISGKVTLRDLIFLQASCS